MLYFRGCDSPLAYLNLRDHIDGKPVRTGMSFWCIVDTQEIIAISVLTLQYSPPLMLRCTLLLPATPCSVLLLEFARPTPASVCGVFLFPLLGGQIPAWTPSLPLPGLCSKIPSQWGPTYLFSLFCFFIVSSPLDEWIDWDAVYPIGLFGLSFVLPPEYELREGKGFCLIWSLLCTHCLERNHCYNLV